MSISFCKLEGTGNDFIFLNQDDFADAQIDKSAVAKHLCQRKWGVGADGLVFTHSWNTDDDVTQFQWDFYNSDGSLAEMCGNAARCAVVYNLILNGSAECEFQTAIGKITGTFEDNLPQVFFDLQNSSMESKTVEIAGNSYDGYFLNTGVPHFVIPLENIETLDSNICRQIQVDPIFGKEQTNVTPLQIGSPSLTRSFERGVRSFTHSCGTGVIAAAKVLQEKQGVDQSVLKTPGGELEVALKKSTVSLKGPAFCVFKGTIDF